jgi:hypothetical protein
MEVKALSDQIAVKSAMEAEYHPIDRYFLEPYIKDILAMNRDEFLLYNFERVNNLYTVHLMLCIPELWETLTVSELIAIVKKITNVFSFFALILFTYKYVEINIIDLILSLNIPENTKAEIIDYLKRQYNNLLKEDGETFVIDEGIIGVKNEDWMYIKQKFLLDVRVEPALKSIGELKYYIDSL